ncbi:MAG TPA: malate synthase G, partial [Methylovirgula sp.]
MRDYQDVGGLKIARPLYDFVTEEALPGTGITAASFWDGFEKLIDEFAPQIQAHMQLRDALQSKIDDYHVSHRGLPFDPVDYEKFLREIGYLVPEPPDFSIATENVDDEIALVPGPQLVVPVSNARYVLNAANARWGSLYEALYGTDAISSADGGERGKGYNKIRGARVVTWGKEFLDASVPFVGASYLDVAGLRVGNGKLIATLADGSETGLKNPAQLRAYRGQADAPTAVLLRNNGLHIELVVDRASRIGGDDPAGVADILIEAALTAIMDLEDSVAAVDAADKVGLYRNVLGLMQGTFSANVEKNGKIIERRLADDCTYTQLDGAPLSVSGRS